MSTAARSSPRASSGSTSSAPWPTSGSTSARASTSGSRPRSRWPWTRGSSGRAPSSSEPSVRALARELRQVGAEVALREVAVPRGGPDDPEGAGDLDVVVGVAGRAVVVDVEGDPDLAGIAEHELAVGVVEAGAARAEG